MSEEGEGRVSEEGEGRVSEEGGVRGGIWDRGHVVCVHVWLAEGVLSKLH